MDKVWRERLLEGVGTLRVENVRYIHANGLEHLD